jgi:hypothetical protein
MIDKDMPCKRDCPARQVGCHSVCEKYIEWHENRVKRQKEIYKQKNLEMKLDNYEVARRNRLKKYLHKWER